MRRLVINDLVPSKMHHTETLQAILLNEFADKGVVMNFIWKNYPLALHESCHIVVSMERTSSGFTIVVEELFKTHPRAQSVNPVSFRTEINPSDQNSSGYIMEWIKTQMRNMPITPSLQTETYDVF